MNQSRLQTSDVRHQGRDVGHQTPDVGLRTSGIQHRLSSKPLNPGPLRSHVSGLKSLRAFTLVELMLVVVIIGVLAAMVVPRLAGRTEQAKRARAASDLAAIGLALDLYELDAGQYPSTLEELVAKDAPSSLSQEAKAKWNGPYLKKGLPKDPWGRAYVYSRESQHSQDYDLYSAGPDGQPGHDDVTNWD